MKPQYPDYEESLETKADKKRMKISTIIPVLAIIAVVGSCGIYSKLYINHTERKAHIRENLAPNALYFKSNIFDDTTLDFPVSGVNRDVDGDGTLESVLVFKNPVTGETESRLIENYGGNIRIREFEVFNGEIIYLTE